MITDPVELRHVTMWGRGPGLEIAILVECPSMSGAEFLERAGRAINLRGFWAHPRLMRDEPTMTIFPGIEENPAGAIIPRISEPGAIVGVNVFLSPVPEDAADPKQCEILLYIPLDIFEAAWDTTFFTTKPEEFVAVYRDILHWVCALRHEWSIERAVIALEGMFKGWADESAAELAESGLYVTPDVLDLLNIEGDKVTDRLRRVDWEMVEEKREGPDA